MITLNVNCLIIQIKHHRLSKWVKDKQKINHFTWSLNQLCCLKVILNTVARRSLSSQCQWVHDFTLLQTVQWHPILLKAKAKILTVVLHYLSNLILMVSLLLSPSHSHFLASLAHEGDKSQGRFLWLKPGNSVHLFSQSNGQNSVT